MSEQTDDPDLSDIPLEGVAYHEAAHAIVCLYFGRKVHRVSVVPDQGGERLGHALMSGSGKVKELPADATLRQVVRATERAEAEANQAVTVLLAGVVAESKRRGLLLNDCLLPDLLRHLGSDLPRAVEMLSPTSSSENEMMARLTWLFLRTADLVAEPDIWEAIGQLAALLVEKKTVSGAVAVRIFRAVVDGAGSTEK